MRLTVYCWLLMAIVAASPAASQQSPWINDPDWADRPIPIRTLERAEIQLLQDALIWSGDYIGLKDGGWGRQSGEALRRWRLPSLARPIDTIAPSEIIRLIGAAALASEQVGWTTWRDPNAQVWIGYPERMVRPSPTAVRLSTSGGPTIGTNYVGSDAYQLTTRWNPNWTLATARQYMGEVPTYRGFLRQTYRLDRGDRQVVSAEFDNGKSYYARYDLTPEGWKGFTLLIGTDDRSRLIVATSAEFSADGLRPIRETHVPTIALTLRWAAESLAQGGRWPGTVVQPAPPTASAPAGSQRGPWDDYAAHPPVSRPSPRQPVARAPSEADRGPAQDATRGPTTATGFFVSDRGHILTNAHAVQQCARITVSAPGTPAETARLVAEAKPADLALLLSSLRASRIAAFRSTPRVRQGEEVAAYGFPLAGALSGGGNLTVGHISALSGLRDDPSRLQISAPIQPGNSGGPVVDRSGNVVGVVVAKLDSVAMAMATGDIPQNVNFAIKSQIALTFLEAHGVAFREAASSDELVMPEVAERVRAVSVRIRCEK